MLRNLDPNKNPRAKGQKKPNTEEKPLEYILSRVDYFESPENDIPLEDLLHASTV